MPAPHTGCSKTSPKENTKNSLTNSLTMVNKVIDLIELEDIWCMIQSNLLIWERVNLSLVCKDLYKTVKIRRGEFEQVKNKYYTNLQLMDQYNEWRTLLHMRKNGCAVWVPRKVTYFIQSCNSFKRELSNPKSKPHPTSWNSRTKVPGFRERVVLAVLAEHNHVAAHNHA